MGRTVRYRLRGASFEWDTDKAAANELKHGVPFELACEVFFDPFLRIVDADPAEEVRYAANGYTNGLRLLFIVHLAQDEEITRIISARRTTPSERETYDEF